MTPPESKTTATMQKAQDTQAEVADTLRDTVHETTQKVTTELSGAAEKTRAGAAREIKEVADALHTAAEELDDGSPQRRMFDMVAKNLEEFSEGIHHKNMGEMLGGINDLARRNPLLFLGGAALLGFAATRLASASASHDHHSSTDHTSSPAASQHSTVGTGQVGAATANTNPSRGI